MKHGEKMDGLFMSGEAARDDATVADECLSSCLLQPRDKQAERRAEQTGGGAGDQTG